MPLYLPLVAITVIALLPFALVGLLIVLLEKVEWDVIYQRVRDWKNRVCIAVELE